MPKPIVIAHHLIWTVYGYWLPNDPRGSMSKTVACDLIAELGELHYGRKRIQPSAREVEDFHNRARGVLKYPLLVLQPKDFFVVADALDRVIQEQQYTCYACAIMPDHVHILIRKHKHLAENMLGNFQSASRRHLCDLGIRTEDHPVWGGSGWKVFLDMPTDVERTIHYINENPVKSRLMRQCWPFVKTYDGWPFYPGHSPKSPYARRLGE